MLWAAVQTVIGFEVKLNKGDGTENAPIYESNSISVEESRILLNGILCISVNIILQLHVSMFSEDSFVFIESWELYLHKKHRLSTCTPGTLKHVIATWGRFIAVVVP